MRQDPMITTLFLDFDGVVCNSLEECYRSSWLASAGIEIGAVNLPEPPFNQTYRARFDACRPFIRSGEDYLVVHEWAARGLVPGSQEEFDASLVAKGPEAMAVMKAKLYTVRDRLLETHRADWLSWNPLYRGMAEALKSQIGNETIWILSTKKAEFIIEILRFHGVDWPLARTIYTGPRKKINIIDEMVSGGGACLIDDQIDHLDFNHRTCVCALASWGYMSPGAELRAPRVWDLDTAVDYIKFFPRPRHQSV